MARSKQFFILFTVALAGGSALGGGEKARKGAAARLPLPRSTVVEGPGRETTRPASPAVDCGGKDCAGLPFTATISAKAVFDAFASDDHQLGVFGRSVKFFVDARTPATGRPIHFINANYKVNGATPPSAKMHYDFAQQYLKIPESGMDYNGVTYFTNAKRYFAGTIQRHHIDATGEEVYGVQFFPQDIIAEATVLDAVRQVAAAFKVEGPRAFVATGEQQTTAAVKGEVEALGFKVMSINEVLGTKDFLPLNAGEAWGYLRVFPPSPDDLRPTDLPVFDELPLDLTVVAGVITKAYQDPNSHVNLKSRERRTPNMMLRHAALDAPEWRGLNGKAVHLTVAFDKFTIEPSTDEQVRAKHAERLAKPWVPMTWDAAFGLASYDEMCRGGDPAACLKFKKSYGSKAANLGFLAHPKVLGRAGDAGTLSARLGYDISPKGVGVPFSYYDATVNAPANAELKAAIAALVAAEVGGALSPAERRSLADGVKALFLRASLPEGMAAAVKKRLGEVLPGVKRVKVRSSANAEDVSGFNGAGLYDSFKARPELKVDTNECIVQMKPNKYGAIRAKLVPDTLECAIKAAYGSLWNSRAIDERTFARLAQGDAVMGLAIVATYDHEAKIDANAVLITRVLNSDTLSGYAISTNDGNNLVTNPAPETWSEQALAVILTEDVPTSITVTRFAKTKGAPAPATKPVMMREQTLTMVEIAKAVEIAYCGAEPDYFPVSRTEGRACQYTLWDETKPKALDFEFKLLKNGHFVAKQVREFTGLR